MKLLLHACCGPCSLEPWRILSAEGHDISIAYIDPNIHPAEEYERRFQTIRVWAEGEHIELIEGEYDPDTWERTAGIFGTDREARCRACYRLRFERTARLARERGFDGISTTLSVSPYQFTGIIAEELGRAARGCGLEAVFKDFRPNYPEATRRSRELGMYRQNYCGCHFSYLEAEEERAARKAARKAAKAAKLAARQAAEADQAARKAEHDAAIAEHAAREAAKRRARNAARAARKAAPDEAGASRRDPLDAAGERAGKEYPGMQTEKQGERR